MLSAEWSQNRLRITCARPCVALVTVIKAGGGEFTHALRLPGAGIRDIATSRPSDVRLVSFPLFKAPRTLYVSRSLENAADVIAWAKSVGFGATVPAEEMHVTIAFSRNPIEWSEVGKAGSSVTVKGGSRSVEKLGDKGAIVLRFDSSDLKSRWAEIKRAGASWDYPGYKPHVTITYKGPSPSLSDIKSYDGDLIFGPERFQEVEEDWEQKITEKSDPMARALAAIAALRRK